MNYPGSTAGTYEVDLGGRALRSMAAPRPSTNALGGFVVDRCERRDVTDKFVQQGGFDQVRLLRDKRLLGQYHLLSCGRGQWTTGASRCNHDHVDQGYHYPVNGTWWKSYLYSSLGKAKKPQAMIFLFVGLHHTFRNFKVWQLGGKKKIWTWAQN